MSIEHGGGALETTQQPTREDIISWVQTSAGRKGRLQPRFLFDRNAIPALAKQYEYDELERKLKAIEGLQLQKGDPVNEKQRQHAIDLYQGALARKGQQPPAEQTAFIKQNPPSTPQGLSPDVETPTPQPAQPAETTQVSSFAPPTPQRSGPDVTVAALAPDGEKLKEPLTMAEQSAETKATDEDKELQELREIVENLQKEMQALREEIEQDEQDIARLEVEQAGLTGGQDA